MQMLHRVLREDGMILIAEPVADIAILNTENGQEQSIRQVSFYEELFETYGFQILDSKKVSSQKLHDCYIAILKKKSNQAQNSNEAVEESEDESQSLTFHELIVKRCSTGKSL